MCLFVSVCPAVMRRPCEMCTCMVSVKYVVSTNYNQSRGEGQWLRVCVRVRDRINDFTLQASE